MYLDLRPVLWRATCSASILFGSTNYTIDNGRPIDEAIDLFGLGVACIATGTHIEAYKKKALGQLADAEEQSKPEANDEILDPEHEDYIDEDY